MNFVDQKASLLAVTDQYLLINPPRNLLFLVQFCRSSTVQLKPVCQTQTSLSLNVE